MRNRIRHANLVRINIQNHHENVGVFICWLRYHREPKSIRCNFRTSRFFTPFGSACRLPAPPCPRPLSRSLSAFFTRLSVLAISIFICSSSFRRNSLNDEHGAKNILYFIEVVCKAVAPDDEKAERAEKKFTANWEDTKKVCACNIRRLFFGLKSRSGRVLKLGELMRQRSASRTSNNFPFTHKSTRRSRAVLVRRTGRARFAFKCSALRSGPK